MITPSLFYRDPMAAIRFLERAFGFEVSVLLTDDQGRLGHSELLYGDDALSVGGEWESEALLGPAKLRSPASLAGAGTQFLRIAVNEPIDAHCERARAAGARITQAPEDQFYGDRTYRALDLEGHVWNFTQRVRDVSIEEMQPSADSRLQHPSIRRRRPMTDWRPALVSALCYRDAKAALAWLTQAFGFETVMLIEDDEGNLAHSEMRFEDAAVMIGNEWSADHKSPASIGGKNTQTVHIQIKSDIDAHCERARAAGADILAEPETQFYGDRTYRCRDLEGHIWTIGQTVEVVSREEAEKASGMKIEGWIE